MADEPSERIADPVAGTAPPDESGAGLSAEPTSEAAATAPTAEQPEATNTDLAAEPAAESVGTSTGSGDGGEEGGEEAEQIPVDEEVYRMKSHRRRGSTSEAQPAPKEKQRRRPRRAESRSARSSSPPPQPPVDEDPAARERRELEERIDAALKPGSKRRKRLAGDDIEMLQDDVVARLRDAMREAALLDVECIRKGEPAVHKMKMLPEVQGVLQKRALADSILDGNLLESVRIWLEPLPDASLPSFEIQKTLFGALVALPIKTIHLRESGLGRVVLFYQKSKRPQPVVKRMAQKLVGDWTRPIIGRSDNYRDRMVQQADFDPDSAPTTVTGRANRPLSSYEESAARRNRAALPSATGISYQVAPVNAGASQTQGPGRSSTADSQLRRMKTKLAMNRSRSRKSQVSVEGKGLNTG